jgi:hypothetical protein
LLDSSRADKLALHRKRESSEADRLCAATLLNPATAMNKLVVFTLGLLSVALTGCSGVFVAQPIGAKPATLAPGDWEGTWFDGSDACKARVIDSAGGRLQLLNVKIKDNKAELETTELLVRESEGWLFFNLRDDDPAKNRYAWARGKLDGDQLVVWVPDRDAFAALIRSGKLKGHVEDKDVFLDPPTSDDFKALTSGALGVPFEWEKPFVFRRLAH